MASVFKRPLLPGWVYPCSLEDIRQRLRQLPGEDLGGLWAVGLVPSTYRNCSANARYFPVDRPVIHIYSYPATFSYKLPPHMKCSDLDRSFSAEFEFGMRVEQVGSRWWCRWDAESLRRFILEYVLAHEVGHHVSHRQRIRQGLKACPGKGVCEQFAEAYARRHVGKLHL
jgi:hypothetical protein